MKAIAAMAENRVIGMKGTIPWSCPADMQFFKATTTGHHVIMGRKTFQSFPKPLPNRNHIVLSAAARNYGWTPNVQWHTIPHDIRHFSDWNPKTELALEPDARECFVIGGAEIYELLLPSCTTLFLSVIRQEVEGDTFMPEFEHLFSSDYDIVAAHPGVEIRRYKRAAPTPAVKCDPTPRLHVMREFLGYSSDGNAPDLLSEIDRANIDAGNYTRPSGEAMCRCGVEYRLHPPVQGALWLTRTCNGLMKL